MGQIGTHGGKRSGAGRPKGSLNRRFQALADELLRNGDCPATALIRLAKQAELNGNLALAVDAWKSLLPYVHPKPKPIEIDPDGVIALCEEITKVRAGASKELISSYSDALLRAEQQIFMADMKTSSSP